MLKVLVPIKRVIDAASKIRIKYDNSTVDPNMMKMSMNPFCENAVEEAVRLKEAGHASELTAITIGHKQASDVLRTALAMGVDNAILVETDLRPDIDLLPLSVARILRHFVQRDAYNLVLMGKQAIDNDCNQSPQILAGMLGWSQGTFLSKLVVEDDGLLVEREIDGGIQTLKLSVPSVLSCDLRINQPRFTPIPAIMKARKKQIEQVKAESLGLDLEARYSTLSVDAPDERKAGVIVQSVDELIDKLRNEAKVLQVQYCCFVSSDYLWFI